MGAAAVLRARARGPRGLPAHGRLARGGGALAPRRLLDQDGVRVDEPAVAREEPLEIRVRGQDEESRQAASFLQKAFLGAIALIAAGLLVDSDR